jgi:hypothetical protein
MPRMFSLFPNHDAPLSGWLAQHSGVLLLFAGTIAVCSFLAWHFRHVDDGTIPDLGECSDGGDGGGD